MKNFYCKKMMFTFTILMGFLFIMWGMNPSIGEAQKKPVKIGFLGPLSTPGEVAVGKRVSWGSELGIQYVNEVMKGVIDGRPVELVPQDDAGTPADGIAGYRKLVQKDGVVAVMGQVHSSVCIALANLSKEMGVPVFSTAAGSDKITETGSPMIFSIMALLSDRSKAFIDFAKTMGWKRVAVMGEDTDFGTGYEKWVKKYGADEGIEVKSIIFPRTASDLTPALLTIKASKPDLVINAGAGHPCYLLVNQAFDIGLFPQTPMLAVYDWPVLPEFWNASGNKGKYILYTGFYKPGMKVTPSAEWMIPAYKKLHNEDPTYFALNAFGQILVIAQALNLAKSDDPKALQRALISGAFQDWNGPVKFEESPGAHWHQVSAPILILQQTEAKQAVVESKLVWPLKFGGDGKIVRP